LGKIEVYNENKKTIQSQDGDDEQTLERDGSLSIRISGFIYKVKKPSKKGSI